MNVTANQAESTTRRYSRYATELLQFFVLHRTATAKQVQRCLGDVFGTDRGTRMHLRTLVRRKELSIVRHGCTMPNVYVATQRGLNRVADRCCLSTPSRWRQRSGSHLAHELLITELAVAIAEAATDRPDVELPWQSRFQLADHPAFSMLVPDYAFLFRHTGGLLTCLAEVVSGEQSSTRIARKLQQYATWAVAPETQNFLTELYKSHGAHQPRPQFRLLFVMHSPLADDQPRATQLLVQVLRHLPESTWHRVWVTTAAELTGRTLLDPPIWLRARDLSPIYPRWQALPRRLQAPHLSSMLPQQPRYPLFPTSDGPSNVTATTD